MSAAKPRRGALHPAIVQLAIQLIGIGIEVERRMGSCYVDPPSSGYLPGSMRFAGLCRDLRGLATPRELVHLLAQMETDGLYRLARSSTSNRPA
jgi:hypothetical protein